MLVPSKAIFTTLNQFLTWHCSQMIDKQWWVSLSEAVKGLVISECRSDERGVIELAAERAVGLIYKEKELRLS